MPWAGQSDHIKAIVGLGFLISIVGLAHARVVYSQHKFCNLLLLQLVLVKKLPARALTRMFGHITRIHLTPRICAPLLGLFCAVYGIRREEAEIQDLRKFSSLHSFFTRKMKEEARPVCPEHSVVSSCISSFFTSLCIDFHRGSVRRCLQLMAQ